MARVIYQGPSDAIEVAGGIVCQRGEAVEVPDELANGTPPVLAEPDEKGNREELHPGTSGLLAQTDAWQPASPVKPAKPTPAVAGDPTKE